MERFNFHLQQLPNFLQSEVASHVGHTNGFSPAQIVARYRAVAEHLIANKRATFQPVNSAEDILAGVQSTKEDLDVILALRGTQSLNIMANPFEGSIVAHIASESIRFLTSFTTSLLAIQAQLEEEARQLAQRQAEEAAARQLAQRQAEEAARQLAQRQAEEAARRQAKEAARQLAQRQAEETARRIAEEAARQLAQRQVEEAARALAQRQAEEAARQLAQRQAEEVARQLVQRQAEEAARQLAQRQAEEAALEAARADVEQASVHSTPAEVKESVINQVNPIETNPTPHSSSVHSFKFVSGPKAIAEIENAALDLNKSIDDAIAEFAKAIGVHMDVSEADSFQKLRYIQA